MIDNLEFLRGEITKVQKELAKTKANDYKKYATLEQAYYTHLANFMQAEALRKQQEEQRQRELEIKAAEEQAARELAMEEAPVEMEENK